MISFFAFVQVAIVVALIGFIAGVVCTVVFVFGVDPKEWRMIGEEADRWFSIRRGCV